MRITRTLKVGGLLAGVLLMVGLLAPPASGATDATTQDFTVLAADGVAAGTASAAIERLGGEIVARTDAVGMFTVRAGADFAARAAVDPLLAGAARRIPIGSSSPGAAKPDLTGEDQAAAAAAQGHPGSPAPGLDPLDDKLWGLRMTRADQARRINGGDRRVAVGILDTGLDASHPDLAPNFDWARSRNFAPDVPLVDGPCEVPSCLDPVGTDDNGHGSHVAGTVAAAANGYGVSGVAPNVTLVELKGGQDSGFFFLEPTVNALVYAAGTGIDVVNMSFFVDPWLYNCVANPADSAAEQAEQRTIITAMFRTLAFAHAHGVTLVGALGNNHEDLGAPRTDIQSPNFPPGTEHPRPIDNATCWDLPVEGPFVLGVSALGPSTTKADFSNYGTEQIDLSAPGGYFRDGLGTPSFRTNGNLVLSAYPRKRLFELGRIDADGNIVPAFATEVFKECTADGRCGYFRFLSGTSMAAPHAVGVAALIVSRFGHHDPFHPGLRMAPWKVESVLKRTAADHACPTPRLKSYVDVGRPEEFNAFCAGEPDFNGFYGHGIVDALAAVTAPPSYGT